MDSKLKKTPAGLGENVAVRARLGQAGGVRNGLEKCPGVFRAFPLLAAPAHLESSRKSSGNVHPWRSGRAGMLWAGRILLNLIPFLPLPGCSRACPAWLQDGFGSIGNPRGSTTEKFPFSFNSHSQKISLQVIPWILLQEELPLSTKQPLCAPVQLHF